MKRMAMAATVLLMALPLAAASSKLVDDVIRMAQKGVADDVIVALIDASAERPAVTADDVIAMTKAGVSRTVIETLIRQPVPAAAPAGAEGADDASDDATAVAPPDADLPIDASIADSGGPCSMFEPPIEISAQDPFYPSWLWDPYWYMPQLDTRDGAPPTMHHPALGAGFTERTGMRTSRTGVASSDTPPHVAERPRPDAPRPDAPRPDAPRADAPRRDAPRPDSGSRGSRGESGYGRRH